MDSPVKVCIGCLAELPVSNFYRSSGRPGYRSKCKRCSIRASVELARSKREPSLTRLERFQQKYRVTIEGCWEWTGSLNPNGYGMFNMGDTTASGKRRPEWAHRASYRLHRGEIPEGLELDHLCRNTRCVNPDHLEPVTERENFLRGDHHSAQMARLKTCKRGHERTPETWRKRPDGQFECVECVKIRNKASGARRRQR